MMVAETIQAGDAGLWGRLRRLPFIVMLTLGLLLSMVHCAGEFAFAADATTVAMADHTDTSRDLTDQQMPAHSGHCLSHVTAQTQQAVVSPADFNPRALIIAGDPIPATRDGLPLFKPPRA